MLVGPAFALSRATTPSVAPSDDSTGTTIRTDLVAVRKARESIIRAADS